MSEAGSNLSPGREQLRNALGDLQQEAIRIRAGCACKPPKRHQWTRTHALEVAFERRGQYTQPDLKRAVKKASNWFRQGVPAKDFLDLWALVEVLLEWSGSIPASASSRPAARQIEAARRRQREWKDHWSQAQKESGGKTDTRLLENYLKAAARAAREHPYPGLTGETEPPPLAQVYVCQQTHPHGIGPDQYLVSTGSDAPPRSADPAPTPAGEVFAAASRVCLLLGGPGGGKSSLLRIHLAHAAESGIRKAPVPVLVNASALSGPALLPAALAITARAHLKKYGLVELAEDFFLTPPHAGVPWLVMVDGLDELANSDQRRTVLKTLIHAAETAPELYRFVVATRPLPGTELGIPDDVARFELLPFTPGDLVTYAEAWFSGLDDPASHATAFRTAVWASRLHELARIPLMATMLCQLYAADPSRPLPQGRTSAYKAFTDLIYRNNNSKHIAITQTEAINRLGEISQVLPDRQAITHAAVQARDHLPDLINHLAHQRFHGDSRPAAAIIATHRRSRRPEALDEARWYHFLGDLLRPTGLLTGHAGDYVFLHQTFLEYYAARHAARTEEIRAELLDTLLPPGDVAGGNWRRPGGDASFFGFLLDQLLSQQDSAAPTVQRLHELAAQADEQACEFICEQVRLGTALPAASTVTWLSRFARDSSLYGSCRVRAAQLLADVGERDLAVEALDDLTYDSSTYGSHRTAAADLLAKMGERDRAAEALERLADDSSMDGSDRVDAACSLDRIGERDRALAAWSHLVNDFAVRGSARAAAARELAYLGKEAGLTEVLLGVVNDPYQPESDRVDAARALAEMGSWEAGVEAAKVLERLVDDRTVYGFDRVDAARALVEVGEGIDALVTLANDSMLHGSYRVDAARSFVDEAVEELRRLADYRTVYSSDCVEAVLARVDEALDALSRLVDDCTVDDSDRADAARTLTGIGDRKELADALEKLANDPTLEVEQRENAARTLNSICHGRHPE
ncbi:NACHT domain-containing protein [Streptomyces sp. NPDC127038]|uniref:NACHT domain-containing protein n=1 Tax=Streptomyces sp. NPDC127038 TaxID=3347114 RepID=UPI003667AD1C